MPAPTVAVLDENTDAPATLTMLPSSTVEVDSSETAKSVLRLIDLLDDNDDVQDVYANFDIAEDIMAEVAE